MARLYKHGNGDIEMSLSQIKAAEAYLRKTIPDLARTELTGRDGGAVQVSWPLPQSKLDE